MMIDDGDTEKRFLPYVAGVSKRIRKVCRDFNVRTVFKSGPTQDTKMPIKA